MKSPLGAARLAASVVVVCLLTFSALAADVRVYVQFGPGQKAAAAAALAQQNARTHHEFDQLNAVAVTIPEQAQAALARNPAILLVEEDPRRDFLAQSTPYGVDMVEAQAINATGAGIKVGVIDSGVLATHPDLPGAAINGEPFWGDGDTRTWFRDVYSHGTHVVGTLAAVDNNTGVVGVSPGVSIHMVKVFGDTGNWVYSSDVLKAAQLAVAKGARVINMSLGGVRPSRTERLGMDDLYFSKGALLVAAAGNDGTTDYNYPASYNSVISVAAVDDAGAVADFSQKNDQVELSAPGVAVPSTVSYSEDNRVTAGGTDYPANHIEFSARTTVTAPLVFGDFATSTNSAWAGKIVLVERGSATFYEKVRNVERSGGLGCIIYNNEAGNFTGTLGERHSSTIPAVSVSQADGNALKGELGTNVTVRTLITYPDAGYANFDGTSMATPHVAGVAALIWSKYRGATNAQVRLALTNGAQDLGPAGRDTSYGHGLVNAPGADAAMAAIGPASPPADLAPPLITGWEVVVTNARNGTFELRWTTNEAATSDVQLNTTLSPGDGAMNTNHVRTFRGSRGATYYLFLLSKDQAGNVGTSGPHLFTL